MYGHGSKDMPIKDESQGSLEILFDYDPSDVEQKEALFKLKLKNKAGM